MTATILTARSDVSALSFLKDALKGMRQARERSAAHAMLLGLDERMLTDIGLTRNDVLNGRF
ncbi:MAG: DUF1127 domain-containing protein [Hyphomicrobiales bacterium]|nr:DUF1127 domain-containing protein [Hyphomicrobiales bacterium]